MAATNRDIINSAMGASQDPNFDDIQSAMGGGQYGGGGQIAFSIFNTDETSSLDENQVMGAPAAFAEVEALFTQVDAANDTSATQLADLESRIIALEN